MALSVDNVSKLVIAVAEVGSSMGLILADMKVTAMDLRYAPGLLAGLKDFGSVDFKDVLPELKDLSDADKAQLDSVFRANFHIASPTIEAAVDEGLGTLLAAIQAILALAKLGKKPAPAPATP